MSTYQVDTEGGSYLVDTEDAAPTPDVGKVESFARGAANNFPLVPQAIAKVEPGDYSENLSDWKAKAAQAKEANPKTYGAGAVTGALAPLAIPGVGEAMEAAPLTANAALGAASAISDEDLSKNPVQNLEKAGEGALMGGATAGVLGKILPTRAGMTESANNLANKAANYGPGVLSEMSPAERQANGAWLQSSGLVGKDKQAVLDNARGMLDKFGKKIGEISDSAGEEGLHVDPAEHYKALQGLLQKSEEYGGLANKEAKSLSRGYKAGANDILSLPDNPKWAEIQKLKEQYGNLAFDARGEVKDPAAKDTYFALKDMLKGIADKAQENPNLGDEYKEALAGYSKMHPIVDNLEKSLDQELKGHTQNGGGVLHPGRLIAQMPGKARAVLGTAAALSGHPYIGAAAALPEITNPAIQSKAAAGMAQAAPKISGGINQLIHDYLINERRKKSE